MQPVNIAASVQRLARIVLLANGMMIRIHRRLVSGEAPVNIAAEAQQAVRIVLPVHIATQAAKRLVRIVILVPTLLQVVVSLAIAFRV